MESNKMHLSSNVPIKIYLEDKKVAMLLELKDSLKDDVDFLKVLSVYLNTHFVHDWLRQNGKMKGDTFQIDRGPLEKIPIPKELFEQSNLHKSFLGLYCKFEKNILSIEELVTQADQFLEYSYK